ncbi:copper chaperone PCu(A)C [Amycolatopsis aidingensis]|uniref:copper chaperone PCu(A)C n=1 Tax=Amycolatopsis aidingensis TaxID=2842453 RepID=UPI001C0ABEFC|nr:copper chaperone PCu(A)C [Amycolatopsis aidingensis]
MRQQIRRVLGSAALGLAAAIVVAGCGAGQITQTDTQEAAVNGAQATVGSIAIRDATLAYPPSDSVYRAGSNAQLNLRIINDSDQPAELASVSSEAAANATISGASTIAGRNVLVIGSTEGEVPDFQRPTAGPGPIGEATIVLQGLAYDVRPGMNVPVTFTFAEAGQVTVELPVGVPEHPRTNHSEPGAHDESGSSH